MIRQKKIALAIFFLYACFLPAGAYMAYRFLNNTKLVYEAPRNSLVAKSEASAHQHFDNQIGYKPMWILVQSTNDTASIVHNADFYDYCIYLNASVHAGGDLFGKVTFVEGYYFVPDVPKFRDKMIGGPFNSSTMLNLNIADDEDYNTFANDFTTFNDAWLHKYNVSSFTFQYTGVQLISNDLESGILGDLMMIDAISMPLAFAALAYCLRSVRLLLTPLMTVPSTIVVAFSVMLPISHFTTVSSFAPEMAAACMMAITIDYSLFILSRFVDQCEMQHAKFGESEETEWLIIRNVTLLSSHNILISGLTIAVALGGLAFLPITFLSTIGLTMSVGAVSAVCVSMSLMPSILFVFFRYFSTSSDCSALSRCYKRWRLGEDDSDEAAVNQDQKSESSPFLTSPNAAGSKQTPKSPNSGTFNNSSAAIGRDAVTEYHLAQYNAQVSSYWFKVGTFAFHHPLITVAVVLAIGAPFFYYAFQLKVDFDLFNQVPRNSQHARVLKELVNIIGQGSAAPYYLTFAALNGTTTNVWNDPRFFSLINNVTKAVSAQTGQPLDRILSPSMLPPSPETGNATTWLNLWDSEFLYLNSSEYRFLFDRTVSADKSAALLTMYTTFDPFDYHANAYINGLKDVIDAYQGPNSDWVFIGMLGASTDSWSIMHHAMDLFPFQIGITFGVIFLFIAAVFRSIFVPFRMVFTVAYTIGMSYGAGVIMFQHSWLHPVWHALEDVQAYTWTVPIFSFSLLSALALDYDVFLLTRILEFKTMGYSDEAAISKAVWKTGRIISFAGVIMFIAFGSLVFSNTTMLNQFGAVAAFAVAIDTFIIRPFFAPALMAIFPKWAWWPRKFINLERTVEDMRGDLGVTDTAGNSPRSTMGGGGAGGSWYE
jgi:uncharacterized membrane protein YdfJ with MMPL/SSD domain